MTRFFPKPDFIRNSRPPLRESERAVLNYFKERYKNNRDYEIFFRPYLNGDCPDIILMRKGGGVLIIKVVDRSLSDYEIGDEDAQWFLGEMEEKQLHNQVEYYKNNLFNLHIPDLLNLVIDDKRHWSVVSTALYFHRDTEAEACKKYKGCKEIYTIILGNDSLKKEKIDKILIEKSISKDNPYFEDSIYDHIKRILKPPIYKLEEGIEIQLSPTQKKLATSIAGERKRIKGVAGAGKTLVLTHRAVDALRKTNEEVLILVYNITMRGYIEDQLRSVRQEFERRLLHISNYHQFIKGQMNNAGIPFPKKNEDGSNEEYFAAVYSNLDLFAGREKRLRRYKTIMIDEGQDFKEEYYRIIQKYFAQEDAEIVVFADEKQNIYGNELANKLPIVPVSTGPWDRKLTKSFRLTNRIALFATRFQEYFMVKKYDVEQMYGDDEGNKPIDELPSCITYDEFKGRVDDGYVADEIARCIWDTMRAKSFSSTDVTVLTNRIKVLQEIAFYFEERSKESINMMCEEKGEVLTHGEQGDLERLRRNKKANFKLGKGGVNFSTIHSFKGLESPILFIVLDHTIKSNDENYRYGNEEDVLQKELPQKFSDELLYTAITRCRSSLHIINVGNEYYSGFFRQSSLVDKRNIVEEINDDDFPF